MARLYTEKDREKVLRELHIELGGQGLLTGVEAAQVLTRRAKDEQNVDFVYKATALRQHVKQGHFTPGSVDPGSRGSRYPVDQVFRLPLAPKRRIGRKEYSKA